MKSQTCDRHRQVNSMSFGWAWRARWRISCNPVPHFWPVLLPCGCYPTVSYRNGSLPGDHLTQFSHASKQDHLHGATPLWADTVIIVAQRHSGPYGVFTPLVHVCEQCATQKELDGAKTQVICPGCSRTLFVPYQGKAHRRRYCCEACGARARRKIRRLKTHLCSVCKIEFRSARRDARFWLKRLPAIKVPSAEGCRLGRGGRRGGRSSRLHPRARMDPFARYRKPAGRRLH